MCKTTEEARNDHKWLINWPVKCSAPQKVKSALQSSSSTARSQTVFSVHSIQWSRTPNGVQERHAAPLVHDLAFNVSRPGRTEHRACLRFFQVAAICYIYLDLYSENAPPDAPFYLCFSVQRGENWLHDVVRGRQLVCSNWYRYVSDSLEFNRLHRIGDLNWQFRNESTL